MPSSWPAARARLFKLRADLDDFESSGESARAALINAVNRIPATAR
jgi:hypothetical protein